MKRKGRKWDELRLEEEDEMRGDERKEMRWEEMKGRRWDEMRWKEGNETRWATLEGSRTSGANRLKQKIKVHIGNENNVIQGHERIGFAEKK